MRVIDAQTIQLVAPGVLNPFTVSNVAGDDKTINDTNTFSNRQAVTYHAPARTTFAGGQVNVVIGTDGNGNPTLTRDPGRNNISFFNDAGEGLAHGYANGERVVYGVQGSTAVGGLTGGQTYRVLRIDASSLSLAPTITTNVTFTRAVGGGTPVNASMSGVNWSTYGFAAGQSFTISGSGGNNGTYTVASVNGSKLEITTDFSTAGVLAKTLDGNTAIVLSADTSGNSLHSLVRPGEPAFANLVDGQTYYILNRTGSSYQLTASATDTTALSLGSAGLSGTATHWIGTESLDLGAVSGIHQFRINITSSTLPVASQKIVGPQGVSLTERLPLSGDGVSTASAIGSGNGFVGAGNNRSAVTITANVTAWIASAQLSTTRIASSLTATGNVSVFADSVTNARATASKAGQPL